MKSPAPIITPFCLRTKTSVSPFASMQTKPLPWILVLVFLCLLFFVPCSAWAEDGDVTASTTLAAAFDGAGNVTIPTTTLTNHTEYEVTITAASGPSGYGWTSDVVGKTIPANGTLQVQWVCSDTLSPEKASQLVADVPASIGTITYSWTYTKPAYATLFSDSTLLFTYGYPTAAQKAKYGTVKDQWTGFEDTPFTSIMAVGWLDYATSIKTIVVADAIQPVATDYWFYGCNITAADVRKLDLSRTTSMKSMFTNCVALISIDTTGWDTSNVTNMESIFYECTNLETVTTGLWDTSSLTNAKQMFGLCPSLAKLDVSSWNTSNVTNTERMFVQSIALTELTGAEKWDTSKVTTMRNMFWACSKLTLDCSDWNTDSVKDHRQFNSSAYGVTAPEW